MRLFKNQLKQLEKWSVFMEENIFDVYLDFWS